MLAVHVVGPVSAVAHAAGCLAQHFSTVHVLRTLEATTVFASNAAGATQQLAAVHLRCSDEASDTLKVNHMISKLLHKFPR